MDKHHLLETKYSGSSKNVVTRNDFSGVLQKVAEKCKNNLKIHHHEEQDPLWV